MPSKKYCVFGCKGLEPYGVSVYGFPNPKSKPDLFQRWISAVGFYLKESDPKKIFANKKVCGNHFLSCEKTTGNRLIWSAVPSVQLFPLQQSSASFTELDHTYCNRLVRESVLFIEKSGSKEARQALQKSNNDSETNNANISTANVAHEELKPDCEDGQADFDIVNEDICAHVAFEEVIPYCEETTDSYETITKYEKSDEYDVIEEFLIMHPETQAHLPTTEPKINKEADNATINSHIYTKVEETEEVTPDCNAPNACDELLTEYAKSNNVVDQFLVIHPGAENSFPVSEQVDNCVSQENAVINGDVYNEVTAEEFIPDCEGPNDCYDIIAETDNICDVIDEFFTMPAINKGSLPKKEEGENGGNEEKIQSAEMLSYKFCDSCNEKITGLRYKCLHCVDYNHCHKCEMLEAHPDHYMIRMPKLQIAEYIIDRMYHEIKPIVTSVTYSCMLGTIPFYNELDNNNLKAYDSEVDLSESVKSLIRNEVNRAVKKRREFKTYRSKTNMGKIKRIMKMPDHASKRRKMNVHIHTYTTEIKDEIPAIVEMKSNVNLPDTFENADENSKDLEANDEFTPVIARIEHDPTCPGAVHMALSSDVSRLIMEVIKDGKKILYQYVDS